MRRRTPATSRLRGAVTLVVAFATAMVGVLLAPTVASAAPLTNLSESSVHWTVRDQSGALVPGASFTIQGARGGTPTVGNNGAIADCTAVACTGGDRHPTGGEFQATGSGNNFDLVITPDQAPAGYAWDSTASQTASFGKTPGEVVRILDAFTVTRTAPITHPSASCVAGTYYSMLENGTVRQIVDGTNTAFGTGWTGRSGANALGIGTGGTTMFALERSGGTVNSILRYTTSGGYQTAWTGSYATASSSVIAGAVSPSTGDYLFGGFASSGGNLVFDLHRFDPSSSSRARVGTVATGLSATALPPSGANGDVAFDRAGNLIVIYSDSSQLRAFRVPATTLSSTDAQLQSEALPIPPGTSVLSSFNGIAYAADGTLALSNSTTLRTYDPLSFVTIGTDVTNLNQGSQSTDLASCGPPPSLTLRKVVDGRASAADQFQLDIVGGSGVRSATTTGSTNGLQTASVTDVTVRAGQTYTVRELMAGGTGIDTNAYGIALACTGATPSGSGASQSITMPLTPTAVVCTFTNTPLVTTVIVRKDVQDVGGGNQRAQRDWTVGVVASGSAAQSPAVSGGASTQATGADGAARWTVRHASASANASIAISEVQQTGYQVQSLACTVTDRLGAATTPAVPTATSGTISNVTPGSTVDCRFVNREQPTTLTLVNEAHGGKPATDWTLAAAGPSGSLTGPSGATATTAASARVTPGVSYALTASGTPATYVAEGPWVCVDGAGATVAVTSASVTLVRGSSVTCTIVHSTARLVLLQQVEGAGGLEAADFQVTASPASGTPALVATTRTGTDAVGAASMIEVRPGRAYELTSTSDAIHIPLRLEQHDGTLLPDGSLDPEHWTTATSTTATVDARGIAYYRFVALSPLPFSLPVTGGAGADVIQLVGGGLLALAAAIAAGALWRRGRGPTPNLRSTSTRGASMSTIRTRGRLVAGLTAVAVVAVSAVGLAAPASAAPGNPDGPQNGSLTIHKFEQPETALTSPDGSQLPASATQDLTPLGGVEFTIRQLTDVDLTETSGWTAIDGLTAAAVLADAQAYPLGTPTIRTTNAVDQSNPGQAFFANLPIGAYLVQETGHGSNDIAFEAEPFLVSVPIPNDDEWIYNIHVYPKNAVTGIDLTLDDADAYKLGDSIDWTIDITVPHNTEDEEITSFVVTDQLADTLTLTGHTITLDGVQLTEWDGTSGDYQLTVDADNLVTITFTPAGITKLQAAGGDTLSIVLTTTVDSIGDGTIENRASAIINGGAPFVSNEQVSSWGALRIDKVDAQDTDLGLVGATFSIRLADGTVVTGGTTTTGGELLFEGLKAGTYTIVETAAPAGYVLPTNGQESRTQAVAAGALATPTGVEITNSRVPALQLPVTGGDGQMAFLLGGGSLLIIALGSFLVVAGRRRANQQG